MSENGSSVSKFGVTQLSQNENINVKYKQIKIMTLS